MNSFLAISASGQITHQPSIDLKVVLDRKLAKNFKKIGPICCNLSYKSQLLKVWEVLSFLGKFQLKKPQTFWHFFSVKLMWKSQKKHWYLVQSSVHWWKAIVAKKGPSMFFQLSNLFVRFTVLFIVTKNYATKKGRLKGVSSNPSGKLFVVANFWL